MLLFEDQKFSDLQKKIALLREKKGSEKKALALIDQALDFGRGMIVNLLWERALVYQHIVMGEDSKGENKNSKKRSEALSSMEAAILVAGKFVKENKLKAWESRYYRFLGRLYDYKKEYAKAVEAYKKSIPLAKLDPEFVEKGIPRELELEGFLSFSMIMSGKVEDGYRLAKKTFEKYDKSSEGKFLLKKDYATWAIWKSGIPIRTINAFLAKKYVFNRKETLAWLLQVEKVLNPPKSIKVWVDFGVRKDEITALRRKLQEN